AVAIVLPLAAFGTGTGLWSSTQGIPEATLERRLMTDAPHHPALTELATIKANKDWVSLMAFRTAWEGRIYTGSDLLILQAVARDTEEPVRSSVLNAVRKGAVNETDYRRYVQ